ncbi:hypothetical protein L484_021678 [Morus notabilis]|uniref:Uncharacterized protein n=1 Tax=Morus notabilis TaxID=981085 RepID=W9SH88_9ROSA|nr:hypothetical protein L484_021678 [Morus notabilis]
MTAGSLVRQSHYEATCLMAGHRIMTIGHSTMTACCACLMTGHVTITDRFVGSRRVIAWVLTVVGSSVLKVTEHNSGPRKAQSRNPKGSIVATISPTEVDLPDEDDDDVGSSGWQFPKTMASASAVKELQRDLENKANDLSKLQKGKPLPSYS